jgi:MarR family transcriptional regulator, organic hydroperoxide resistance regulator
MVNAGIMIDVMRSIESADTAAPDDPSVVEDPTDGIITDYRATTVAMKCAMSERLVRLGISMAQLNILYTLHRSGEMSMSRLADVLNVSLSNATGLVDRMEERGFIERIRVPEDRRVVRVRIAEAGERVLQENDAQTDDLLRDVLSRLDRTQLHVIARAMADFRASLEVAVGPLTWDRQSASTPAPRSR